MPAPSALGTLNKYNNILSSTCVHSSYANCLLAFVFSM